MNKYDKRPRWETGQDIWGEMGGEDGMNNRQFTRVKIQLKQEGEYLHNDTLSNVFIRASAGINFVRKFLTPECSKVLDTLKKTKDTVKGSAVYPQNSYVTVLTPSAPEHDCI